MVWSKTKQDFKEQLAKISIAAKLISGQNKKKAAQHNDTVTRGNNFLEKLEELNSFYNKDESIEAVLSAAVSYFVTFDQINLANIEMGAVTNEEFLARKQEISGKYQTLAAESQLLVKKMQSPDVIMYGQQKIRCNSLSLGISFGAAIGGFTIILVAALAAGPAGA